MLRIAVRDLVVHPGRFVRTLLAIVLGVGFVAGTFVLTDTTDAAFTEAVDEQSAGFDLTVRSEAPFTGVSTSSSGREPLPESLVPSIATLPGVEVVDGRVIGYAQVVDTDGDAVTPVGPPTLGTSWGPGQLNDLVAGRAPVERGEVALDQKTAERAGVAIGDPVEVLFVGPRQRFTVVGITDSSPMLGATLATFDLATAQRLMEREGLVDSIAVRVEPSASLGSVQRGIDALLERGQEVITVEQEKQEASEQWGTALGFMSTALLVFAGVALVVGAFLIFNTFTILMTQRTRELGLLRAVGASKGQVAGSVLAEATVLGILATGLGIVLGFASALAMLALIRAVGLDLPSTTPVFAPRTFVAAALAGLVTALVSALIPAQRASAVPPIVAMRGGAARESGGLVRRVALGAVLLVVGASSMSVGLWGTEEARLRWIGAGAVLTFVGLAALAPLLARPAAALVGRPLARILGVSGELGQENASRDVRRTAATASALMVGLGLVGFVAILAASIKTSSMEAIRGGYAADLTIRPSSGFGMLGGFSPEVEERLEATPEVGAMSPIRVGQFGLEGATKTVGAVDPDTIGQLLDVDEASAATFARLEPGTVAVHRDVAATHGWEVGDTVPMTFARTGTIEMPIAGLFGGGILDGDEYEISLATYDANFTELLDSAVHLVYADGVRSADGRAAVDAVLADFPNVQSYDQGEMVAAAADSVDQMLSMIMALLALSLFIAFIGIANTLALSISERTRELGLLRAVGMSRRQLKRMVRAEATIVAVLGVGLGLLVAVSLSWAFVQALGSIGVTRYAVPVAQLGVMAVVAVVAAAAAATGPARRAARLPVLDAIARG